MHQPYHCSVTLLLDYSTVVEANSPEEAQAIAEEEALTELKDHDIADSAEVYESDAYPLDETEEEE